MQAGEYTDLRFGNKNVVRYVFERMKPDDRERTYKPFHHVFQSDGKGFLTKGPGESLPITGGSTMVFQNVLLEIKKEAR